MYYKLKNFHGYSNCMKNSNEIHCTVLKDTEINEIFEDDFIGSKYHELREKLINDGIISDRVFIKDYTFSSFSQAASVILATLDEESKEWEIISKTKDCKGKTESKPIYKSEDIIDLIIGNLEREKQSKIDLLLSKISQIVINTEDIDKELIVLKGLKEELNTLKEKSFDLEDILEYVNLIYQKRKNDDGGPVKLPFPESDWIPINIEGNQIYGTQKISKGMFHISKKIVIVLEGSDILHFPTKAFKNSKSFRKYQSLLDDGSICDYKFTRDVIFNSLSAPASIILGRSANGKITWTLENGFIVDSILNQ